MLEFSRSKTLFIMLVCLYGLAAALPNFLGDGALRSLPSFLPNQTMALGLDLRGGVHLLLEADADEIVETKLDSIVDQVRTIRRSNDDITFRGIRTAGNRVVFQVTRQEMVEAANRELQVITAPVAAQNSALGSIQEVTLSREGNTYTLELTEEGIRQAKQQAIARAIEVVRKRVDPEGTKEVTIQGQGADRIILQVPGADDPEKLKEIISTAARLTFHEVDQTVSPAEIRAGRIPPGRIIGTTREGAQLVLIRRPVVGGEDLVDAKPSYSQGQPVVSFTFNGRGGQKFGEFTAKHVNEPFAIKLDDEVISAPVINSPILGGAGIIQGVGSIEEVADLSILLAAGALPVSLSVEEQRTIGPELGADSIEAGKWAAIIGFVGVIIYMAASYGVFGIAANISLIVNLLLIVGLLSGLQATLTLPGIAGIVLTIGMAVDANVLVFERIREEQRAGKKPYQAMEQGYAQAFSTILDANITTFIAAAILYVLGSGPVRGFSVTLAIGIVTSMFTAILFSRLMLATWVKRAKPETLPI